MLYGRKENSMHTNCLAACTHLSSTVSQLFEPQVEKIAIFTQPTFLFPLETPLRLSRNMFPSHRNRRPHINHDMLVEHCSLSYQPTFIDVCVKAGGGHFEHTLEWTTCQIVVFLISNCQCFLTMKITSCCWLFGAKLKIWHIIFI